MENELKKESVIATTDKIVNRATENFMAKGTFTEFVNEQRKKIKSLKTKFAEILSEDHCKKEFLDVQNFMARNISNPEDSKIQKEIEPIVQLVAKCTSKYEAYVKPLYVLDENLSSKVLVEPHRNFFNCEASCLALFVIDQTKEKELYQCMIKCWEGFIPDMKDYVEDICDMVDASLDDLKNRKF